MIDDPGNVRTLDDLRKFVRERLCRKEHLLTEQFALQECPLVRRGRPIGLQFSLQGPRSVRLGAVWAADLGLVYLYDARGERFDKIQVPHGLESWKSGSSAA